MPVRLPMKKWTIRFVGGFIIWLLAIALGLIALKGNMNGFGSQQWWKRTGSVYLVWGFLNFLIFFALVHFIIPFGLKAKRYIMIVLLTYLVVFAIGIIKYFFAIRPEFRHIMGYYKDENTEVLSYYTFGEYMMKTIFTGTFVSVIGFGWGLTVNWFRGEQLRKELENKRMDAELSFLRMQMNPHFLFNSLNSIYSLSLKKSDDTPQAVLKLSEMMRYMIYESEDTEHKVNLEKEIDYLNNYIGLQRIRFKDRFHVEFLLEGDISGKKIVPLLLLPFVENGFKHGILYDPKNPFSIHLVVEGERLIFQVKNKKNIDNKDATGGIGLDNVKRRLLLLYPGKHQLTIHEDKEFYQSELILFL
ncbi:MAG TPA: sensor histidine kinase [Chitinophagaceae bacterium]|nr:sensor histidine kinase [Chitinophagaceae bacterium]